MMIRLRPRGIHFGSANRLRPLIREHIILEIRTYRDLKSSITMAILLLLASKLASEVLEAEMKTR